MSLEARLEAALAAAGKVLEESRAELAKGFPNDTAEAGVHVHNLERESGRTKLDGRHRHLFRLPTALTFKAEDGTEVSLEEGDLLETVEDGPHTHALEAEGDVEKALSDGSAHRHIIILAEGSIELITATDGAHEHDLQTWSSAFDGAHSHELTLADLELESLSGAELWEALGEPSMKKIPPAPPASELASLGEPAELLDPEELDVRIANVAAKKRTLVSDPVEDVRRLAELDPSLAGLAEAETIEKISEVVIEARRGGNVPVVVWQAEAPPGSLPVLKVADPKTVVERLRDGEPTGLLSRMKQVARVGKAQALVNEVEAGGKALVWGVVSQGEPVVVESFEDLTVEKREELAEVLDEATVVAFKAASESWYLPLELGVIFDPPLEFRAPPAGRRFGGAVDFEADVVKSRQLSIDGLLRVAARKGVPGFIRDPAPAGLRKATDFELVEVDRGLHEIFEDLFGGNVAEDVDDIARTDAVAAHVLVLRELENRGVETVETDALATETAHFLRGDLEVVSGQGRRFLTEADLAELGKDVVDEDKQRGEGHLHKLPGELGGGMTELAAGRDHRHRCKVEGAELETGPPVQSEAGPDVRHRHALVIDGAEVLTGTERKPDGTSKSGLGLGPGGSGLGPGGECVCPECGARVPHVAGKACSDVRCPECGAAMTRSELETAKQDGMVIQTLIFSKDVFETKDAAIKWAKDHDFSTAKGVDETETSFRIRQIEPSDFRSDTFRTIEITEGVKAVVGRLAEKAEKSTTIRIVKADEESSEERYVFGVVLVPNEPDSQGDIYDETEVRKAAHSFMEHFGGDTFKIMHDGKAVDGVVVLETYLSKAAETYEGETFPVGTWFLATRVVNDDLWAAIQSGAFTGYSMGGTALREALEN